MDLGKKNMELRGGLAMEELIKAGYIKGVADITTTELADDLVGGIFTAGPNRLEAAGIAGIPQMVSVGVLDMDATPFEGKEERLALYEGIKQNLRSDIPIIDMEQDINNPAVADVIIIYNSGRYRMAGRGSLAGLMPYGDANQICCRYGGRGTPHC